MNKEKISYAGRKVSIGIDVHKRFYVLSAVFSGELIKRCRVPAGSENVIAFIKKHFADAEITTCYEAGFSGFWLHRALEDAGIRNLMIHAASVELSCRDRVKTDKRDSLKLAVQLDAGRLRGIRVPSGEEERARLLTRTREQLMRSITRVRNQIRQKLHQFGRIRADDTRVLSRKMVSELMRSDINGELQTSVEALLSTWNSLEIEKKKLERALLEQAGADSREAIWRSVPGIGPLGSRILSNELGDMSQFPNERKLFSFTGLTPGEYSSGEKVYRGHISRQGSPRLRHVLVEAAWRAIRKDEALKEAFERIAARQGKKRAIVAIARKLIGRARAVFRTGIAYELGFDKAA